MLSNQHAPHWVVSLVQQYDQCGVSAHETHPLSKCHHYLHSSADPSNNSQQHMSTRYLVPAYSVDIQDPMVFSKPYEGPDGCPIPFETLQVKISLTHKGVRCGHAWQYLYTDTVGVLSCHIVPGIRRPSVQQQQRGLMGTCEVNDLSHPHSLR